MSFLETIAFTDILGHWVGKENTQNKVINYIGLHRLLNMITIFMAFCLTYY